MLRKDNLPMVNSSKETNDIYMYYCFNIQATKPRQISDGVGGVQPRKTTSRCYMCVNEENLE